MRIRIHKTIVADPGCLSRIPDPTFFHPGSRIRTVSITDPGSASKNLSILTPKKWFLTLENMIRIVHPGSRIQMLTFYPSWIPDPGVKKAPDPGSGSATLNVTKKNQFSDPPPHTFGYTLVWMCWNRIRHALAMWIWVG